jgi:hypothetical protein
MVRAMYLSQRASITRNADLVLDGGKLAEVSIELVRKALGARGVAA